MQELSGQKKTILRCEIGFHEMGKKMHKVLVFFVVVAFIQTVDLLDEYERCGNILFLIDVDHMERCKMSTKIIHIGSYSAEKSHNSPL